MNIIFLDFDGVLNSQKTIINNIIERRKLSKELIDNRKNKELIIRYRMLDIDSKMLRLVVLLANETNSKVVVTSSWKKLDDYHIIEKELKKMGLPIIGVSLDIGYDRGEGIRNYLRTHKVENYIVIDDEIFEDYDEEILNHLVKTDFYSSGFDEECKQKALKLIKRTD